MHDLLQMYEIDGSKYVKNVTPEEMRTAVTEIQAEGQDLALQHQRRGELMAAKSEQSEQQASVMELLVDLQEGQRKLLEGQRKLLEEWRSA